MSRGNGVGVHRGDGLTNRRSTEHSPTSRMGSVRQRAIPRGRLMDTTRAEALLGDADLPRRREAGRHFRALPPQEAVPALCRVLRSPNWRARGNAAFLLGKVDLPSRRVWENAEVGLRGFIGAERIPEVLKTAQDSYRAVCEREPRAGLQRGREIASRGERQTPKHHVGTPKSAAQRNRKARRLPGGYARKKPHPKPYWWEAESAQIRRTNASSASDPNHTADQRTVPPRLADRSKPRSRSDSRVGYGTGMVYQPPVDRAIAKRIGPTFRYDDDL